MIETTTDTDHTFYSYPEIRNIFRSVPPYYFGVAESRPEGLVDILFLGDSTTALVHNPGDVYEGSRFSMGELLKELNIPGIGNVETRLCWGKGLDTIVRTAKEAIESMNHENFIKGHHSRKILVIIGWSGNDVHGDYGYQGCSWIQSRYLKSDADRKVAAEWPAEQKQRVERSIAELIEMKSMEGVADIVVFGNGGHNEYGLPPSYNITLGKHFQRLSDHGVNCISFELVSMRGYRYDRIHLDDSVMNRCLVTRYLRGLVTFHLAAMEIMMNKDILLGTAHKLLGSDPEKMLYYFRTTPNLLQFRRALPSTPEVSEFIARNRIATFATAAQDCDAKDKEIFAWIEAAWDEADNEATREGAPKGEGFSTEELTTAMPLDLEAEDSDLEEERLRLNLADEFDAAEKEGFSLVPSEEVTMIQAGDSTFDHVDLTNWETVPEAGTTNENDFDLVSLASRHESIILDDETNVEEVESFTHGSVTLTARKDDVEMKDPKEAAADDLAEVKVEKEEDTHAGRPAEPLQATTKKKSKPIPERPLKVTKIDQAEEKLAVAAEQAEDRVWLDPTDLSYRIPYKNVKNSGRLLQASKKLSYFLRGHPLEYGYPCPEFNFLDLSVKWDDLMTHMRSKIWELEDWEVLQVVRSSDTRRFQIQVARPTGPEATWKGLPWMPMACRTFQGHSQALMEKASIAPMVKELYTLDPEFTPGHLDLEQPQWPRFNFNPKQSQMFEKLPWIIYHSCDLANVDNIIQQGLIPGGWPKSSGRYHNYFITMAPWNANSRKLAGTRAGKPMYVAFDLELIMQHGCRVFKTDEAILSPDWGSNECIIAVYDSHQRDFYHFNRAYSVYRKQYQDKIASGDPDVASYENSQLTTLNQLADRNFEDFCQKVGRGNLQKSRDTAEHHTWECRMFPSSGTKPPGRDGRKAKANKGKRDYAISRSECVVAPRLKIRDRQRKKCGQSSLDGHHKCHRCKAILEEPTDLRLATEIARLESFALESYGSFALDQVTSTQPRSQRQRTSPSSGASSGEPRRGGRSNFRVMNNSALSYVKKARKGNYEGLQDRLENDPFFFFNCSNNQLTPPCLKFIEHLASSISPDFSRTSEARTQGKGTDVKTRLIFIPLPNRQYDHAIDFTYESQVAHHGRFFTLSQFAVYAGAIMNARGEPSPIIHGWNGMTMAEGYTGIGKGKGSSKSSYGKQSQSEGCGGWTQPYGYQHHQQHQGQHYWSDRHQQWQPSYPGGGHAGKGSSSSSSSSSKGKSSKGKQERPWEEAVQYQGAMYTKMTYRDGRVEWLAWRSSSSV